MQRTLLLNSSYEVIGFISFQRLMKLMFHYNGSKVDVISEWDNKYITWPSGKIKYPATVRLKYYVRNIQRKLRFNRISVFRRDSYTCQYCADSLTNNNSTIDHIIPRVKGGTDGWLNCVTACTFCNRKKGNKSLEEVGMKLLKKPTVPTYNLFLNDLCKIQDKHESWNNYIVIK